MAASELHEHLGYWLDDAKVQAYRAALNEVVSPGDQVLDLGSGTGLLGLLAAQAGASAVWSFDSGSILGAARAIAEANGLGDRMHFVKALTTDAALPQADVVICDQIGGLVFDAGVLEFFADAKQRSLRAGGVLMPSHFELFLAPVQAPGPYEQIDGWNDRHGLDLTSMRTLAANTEHRTVPDDIDLLADGVMISSRASDDTTRISHDCEWVARCDATLHGLSGWFNAQMSPSVTMTNHPSDPGRMNRWLNFYPLERPVPVTAGTLINGSIDIRPEARLVTWSVKIGDEPAQRMSTFHGQFMFEPSATLGAPADKTDAGGRAELMNTLTGMSLQGAAIGDLIVAAQRCTELFETQGAAASFARRVHQLLH